MNRRRILLVILLSAMPLLAEAEPWRARVDGPSGLPDVEVTLGYRGGYVSSASSPIVLDIRSGNRPFDGYAGFHIAAGPRRTVDGAVVTRVALSPRASQRFSSWARTVTFNGADPAGREVVIEWRDRDMQLIATKSAGAPPWEESRPLVLPFDGLGTTAQWYAGFSRLVTPTDHWFELPIKVREAVFHSGIHVVFVGVPSKIPAMTDIDRALLPVEIRPGASILEIPWPYARGGERQRSVEMSWVAKPATRVVVGSERQPYLVASRMATFAAGDEVLDTALPSLITQLLRDRAFDRPVERRPRLSELVRDMRPLLVGMALLPLPLLGWMAMRRRPRWTILAALAVVAVMLIIARDATRGSLTEHEVSVIRIHSAGVFDTIASSRVLGSVPIPAASPLSADAVARPSTSIRGVEVRSSGTSPGFGALDSSAPWDSMTRTTLRRQLGSPSTIRTRVAGSNALVVTFESPIPVDYVRAIWICEGRRCSGTAAAPSTTKGEVTVRNGIDSWSCPTCLFDSLEESGASDFNSGKIVELIQITAGGAAAVRHLEPSDSVYPPPYALSAPLERKGSLLVASFALPSGSTQKLRASIALRAVETRAERITLRGEGGAVELPGNLQFTLADGDLSRIAPDGGIILMEIETNARASRLSRAQLVIRERKS